MSASVQVVAETPKHPKPKDIVSGLRAKLKTSQNLAADVEKALDELEETLESAEGLSPFLDILEDVVNATPDAKLRERLLGFRMVIDTHPGVSIEQLPSFA